MEEYEESLRICEFCGKSKDRLVEDKRYYDFGFKLRKYMICNECQDKKDYDYKKTDRAPSVLTTHFGDFTGYEALVRIIREKAEKSNDNVVDYYEAAKEAFLKSNSFCEYLNQFDIIKNSKIDKNLQAIWEITHKISNGLDQRIKVVNNNPDNFKVS